MAQLKQIHSACGGRLDQAGEVRLAFPERGLRLGIEPDYLFLP